jgi:hypothetical protein
MSGLDDNYCNGFCDAIHRGGTPMLFIPQLDVDKLSSQSATFK